MSLKDIDFDSIFRRLADRRIEEAMQEGKFDNLPGKGQPLDLEPMPAEEAARMRWWALRILRGADVIPDEVRWRKQIDLHKDELARVTDERKLPGLVAKINALVRKINTMGTNAINNAVVAVDLEVERARLRAQNTATEVAAPTDPAR